MKLYKMTIQNWERKPCYGKYACRVCETKNDAIPSINNNDSVRNAVLGIKATAKRRIERKQLFENFKAKGNVFNLIVGLNKIENSEIKLQRESGNPLATMTSANCNVISKCKKCDTEHLFYVNLNIAIPESDVTVSVDEQLEQIAELPDEVMGRCVKKYYETVEQAKADLAGNNLVKSADILQNAADELNQIPVGLENEELSEAVVLLKNYAESMRTKLRRKRLRFLEEIKELASREAVA